MGDHASLYKQGPKLDSVTGVEVQEIIIIIIQILTQPISIYSHMQAGYVYAYSLGSKRKKKRKRILHVNFWTPAPGHVFKFIGSTSSSNSQSTSIHLYCFIRALSNPSLKGLSTAHQNANYKDCRASLPGPFLPSLPKGKPAGPSSSATWAGRPAPPRQLYATLTRLPSDSARPRRTRQKSHSSRPTRASLRPTRTRSLLSSMPKITRSRPRAPDESLEGCGAEGPQMALVHYVDR